MAIQRKIARARNRALVGSEVAGAGGGPLRRRPTCCGKARMPTQAPEIDGVTLINDFEGAEPRPGEIRRLRITEAHDYDVVGTLLPGGHRNRAAGRLRVHRYLRPLDPAPYDEVSHLQKESRLGRPRFSVLQRAVPHHRPGQLGLGEVRDLHAPRFRQLCEETQQMTRRR